MRHTMIIEKLPTSQQRHSDQNSDHHGAPMQGPGPGINTFTRDHSGDTHSLSISVNGKPLRLVSSQLAQMIHALCLFQLLRHWS